MTYQFYVDANAIEQQEELLKKRECKVIVVTTATTFYLRGFIENIQFEQITLSLECLDLASIKEELTALLIMFDGIDNPISVYQFNNVEDEKNACSERQEHFLDVISDVNWLKDFDLGVGIDAVTNIVHKSAVVSTKRANKKETGHSGFTAVKIIKTSKELSELFSFELGGEYSVKSLDFSNSYEYLKSVKCSEKELSVIIIDKRYEKEYADQYDFRLTEEASKFLKNSPDRFRDEYGDYYISDVRNGAYFFAVYHCIATTSEELSEFNAELSANHDLLTLTTSEKFQKIMKEHNIKLELNLFYSGCKGTIPYDNVKNATDVGNALQWYSTHLQFVPQYARLTHYSCLPKSKVSNVIPYSTDKILEIKSLYTNILQLYSDVQYVPKDFSSITDTVIGLYNQIMMSLSKITFNDEYRQECNAKVSKLQKNLQNLFRLLAAKKLEPKAMVKQKTNENIFIWEFGCFDCDNSQVEKIPFVKKGGWMWQERDIKFNAAPQNKDGKKGEEQPKTPIIILGYRMTSNWTDGTGGDWWKLSNHGILDNELNLHISSYHTRGCDWLCEICYIKKELAKFDS